MAWKVVAFAGRAAAWRTVSRLHGRPGAGRCRAPRFARAWRGGRGAPPGAPGLSVRSLLGELLLTAAHSGQRGLALGATQIGGLLFEEFNRYDLAAVVAPESLATDTKNGRHAIPPLDRCMKFGGHHSLRFGYRWVNDSSVTRNVKDDPTNGQPCEFCGFVFDQGGLGRYGCPNCEGSSNHGSAFIPQEDAA